jgi:hypothetical protein
MQRQSPGLIDSRRQQAGFLPSMEDFANAIANAAADYLGKPRVNQVVSRLS